MMVVVLSGVGGSVGGGHRRSPQVAACSRPSLPTKEKYRLYCTQLHVMDDDGGGGFP